MVGTLSKIAAFFGSKTSLNTSSAYPSSASVYYPGDDSVSEGKLKRSWSSLRLSRRSKSRYEKKGEPRQTAQSNGKNADSPVIEKIKSPPLPQAPLQPLGPLLPQLVNAEPNPKDVAALKHASVGAQALAVVVNYLVNDLDAFSTPLLKRDQEKLRIQWINTKLQLEEANASYNRLHNDFETVKIEHRTDLDQINTKHQEEKLNINTKYNEEIKLLNQIYEERLNNLQKQRDNQEKGLSEKEKIITDKEKELNSLKDIYETEIDKLKVNFYKETKNLKDQNKDVIAQLELHKQKLQQTEKQLNYMKPEYDRLKKESNLFLETLKCNDSNPSNNKNISKNAKELESEVNSLKVVLEMKSTELQELRRQSQTWEQDSIRLPQELCRIKSLTTALEESKTKLRYKEETEGKLLKENSSLKNSLTMEFNKNKRLSCHNEELQYKLKNNLEAFTSLTSQNGDKSPYCLSPNMSVSANGYKSGSENDDICVTHLSEKAIVKTSDSVAWNLYVDETKNSIASKFLRRAQSMKSSSPYQTPSHQITGNKPQRSHSSKSVSYMSPSPKVMDTFKKSPNNNEQNRYEVEETSDPDIHVHEELIIVKSIGNQEVLELLDIDDNSEIDIDDMQLPTKIDKDKHLGMLKIGSDRSLPKDSAGEAMISGETSEDEDVGVSEEEDEDIDNVIDQSDSFDDEEEDSEETKEDSVQEPKLDKLLEKKLSLKSNNFCVDSSNDTTVDFSWSEEAEPLPSER